MPVLAKIVGWRGYRRERKKDYLDSRQSIVSYIVKT